MRGRYSYGICGLFGFLGVFQISLASDHGDDRASSLKSGYAIRILKPLPRLNTDCDSVFRGGKFISRCDGNLGVDPGEYFALRTYCKWDLKAYHDNRMDSKLGESIFVPELVSITEAEDAFELKDKKSRMRERIFRERDVYNRRLVVSFADSRLGKLVCYPGVVNRYTQGNQFYYGPGAVKDGDQNPGVYSGLSVDDVKAVLGDYVEWIKIK